MKGSRFSEEQIIGTLRKHEAGERTPELCRRRGIPDATFQVGSVLYQAISMKEVQGANVENESTPC